MTAASLTADAVRGLLDGATPGPWRILEGKYSAQIHSERFWIANIKCESCPAHEVTNSRLIAMAPDLAADWLRQEARIKALTWRTIDSAPRDGTRIIAITNEYDGCLIVSWRGQWPNGITQAWRDDEVDGDAYINITHWMPLPAPPSAALNPTEGGDE